MDMPFYDSQTFEKLDCEEGLMPGREYYKCVFRNCNLRKCDLSDVDFDECAFEDCDLSMAVVRNTGLRGGIHFERCKLLGVDFSLCNTFRFEVSFSRSHLDYSIFHKLKMPRTRFSNCTLKETDFEEADLSGAVFDACDMMGAGFSFTKLERADLRTSFNYHLDPEQNRIRKALFAYPGVLGLLSKYDIEVE